jgi:transcriptional regulator with XRE-family HTH domain
MAALSERDRETLSVFVDEMRAMREQRGWSQAELADASRYSESLIAMVETYRRPPTESLARALDAAFGTPDTFSRLQRKVRTVSFPAAFRPFADHEALAVALRWFEHSLVPGLLQTEDYARAVLSTRPNASEGEIEGAVADRLVRQQVISRSDPPPPLLWILIDEGALYRPVAPPVVMYDQFMHLVDWSKLPNVTIQVVPYSAGGHSGLLGAFIVAELPASQSVVFISDVSGGRVAEDPLSVSEAALRFDALRSEALPKTLSRDLIVKVAQERWKS